MELGHKAISGTGIAAQLWHALWHTEPNATSVIADPTLADALGYVNAPALLIGTDTGPLLRSWMRTAGFGLRTEKDLNVAVNRLCHVPSAASLVIVSIDAFGGIAATIDQLFRLRDCAPHLPLIVMTSDVEGSDFTTERLAMCDVTLKMPAGAAALREALKEAKANNAVWQARLADLRQAH